MSAFWGRRLCQRLYLIEVDVKENNNLGQFSVIFFATRKPEIPLASTSNFLKNAIQKPTNNPTISEKVVLDIAGAAGLSNDQDFGSSYCPRDSRKNAKDVRATLWKILMNAHTVH